MEKVSESRWADPDAAGFLLCGFYLLLSAPSLMGLIGHEAGIASLPVGLMIVIGLILVILACYKNGDVFGVVMNTVLGIVLIGSVNLMGLQSLILHIMGVEKFAAWSEACKVVDGLSFMIFGLMLLAGGYVVCWRLGFLAISFIIAGSGMLVISASLFGIISQSAFHIGGAMVSQLSICMLYAGFGILLNESMKRKILPLGTALFKENSK